MLDDALDTLGHRDEDDRLGLGRRRWSGTLQLGQQHDSVRGPRRWHFETQTAAKHLAHRLIDIQALKGIQNIGVRTQRLASKQHG